MIYSLVLLICSTDGSECITQSIPQVFTTQERCHMAKQLAETRLDQDDELLGVVRCIDWGQPA